MYSVTVNKPVDVNIYRVEDQDGNELPLYDLRADSDGDLIIKVEVPEKQCQHCRCKCDE